MKQLWRIALPVLVLVLVGACDLEEEVLKQLGMDEVDVEVGMFDERDKQDPLRIDVVQTESDLTSDTAVDGEYAVFYHAVTMPSGGVTHDKLLAMAQMIELVDYFGVDDVGAFGGVYNGGAASADFEIRLYNQDSISDLAAFLDESAPVVSTRVATQSSVELESLDLGDIAGAYADYADAVDPDAQGNYHLFVGATSPSLLAASAGESGIFGYGFFQRTTDLAPGDFSEYAGNVKGIADLSLAGEIVNHSETDAVHVVISFSEQGAPDHDPSVFFDPGWWVLDATIPAGERIVIERTSAAQTEHTQEVLEWAVVKLTKNRHVQTDVGAWSNGAIDITLNVRLESTIETQLDF